MRFKRRLTAIALPTIFLFASAAFAADPASVRRVNELSDFEVHVQAHKARVIDGGLLLKKLHPELFADVPDDLIVNYLELHDVNKLNTPGPDPRRIQKMLFANWGKNLGALPPEFKAKALANINELNSLDAVRAREFFASRKLLDATGAPTPIAIKLQLLEKISDQVDRGLDPIAAEEFGRAMDAASKFIKDPVQQKLAYDLEQNFSEVLKQKSFVNFKYMTSCERALAIIH